MYFSIIFSLLSAVIKQSLISVETPLPDAICKACFFQNFPRPDVKGSLLQYFNYLLRHELFCSISFGRIIFLPLLIISAKPFTYFCETYSDMVSLMSI